MKAALIVVLAVVAMASAQGVNFVHNTDPGRQVTFVNNTDPGREVHFVDSPNGGYQKPSIEPAFVDPNVNTGGLPYPYKPRPNPLARDGK